MFKMLLPSTLVIAFVSDLIPTSPGTKLKIGIDRLLSHSPATTLIPEEV
jgi:hypothetical protein